MRLNQARLISVTPVASFIHSARVYRSYLPLLFTAFVCENVKALWMVFQIILPTGFLASMLFFHVRQYVVLVHRLWVDH